MREPVNYERICGTVASLLLLFARIEAEASEIISKGQGTSGLPKIRGAGGFLRAWKKVLVADATRPEEALLAERIWAQIQEPLDVRNGICHGLIGVAAESGDTPAMLTWSVKESTKSITYDELQELFAWLSRILQAMAMISHAVGGVDQSKLRPLPKRDFWECDFAIKFDWSAGSKVRCLLDPNTRFLLRFPSGWPSLAVWQQGRQHGYGNGRR